MKDAATLIEYGVPIDAEAMVTPPDTTELELEPGHPGLGDAAYVQAVSLINERRYDEALASLDKAAATFGPHPDILTYQGYTWRKKGDYARAETYYLAVTLSTVDGVPMCSQLGGRSGRARHRFSATLCGGVAGSCCCTARSPHGRRQRRCAISRTPRISANGRWCGSCECQRHANERVIPFFRDQHSAKRETTEGLSRGGCR